MTKIYECDACGILTEAREQVCSPRQLENKGAYCSTTPEEGELCASKKDQLIYVCGSCGRVAEQSDLLCEPFLTG